MTEQPDPMIGRNLAQRYRIDAAVARGGMARVYRARDERLDRDVAVKVLSAPFTDDPAFTEQFLAEARAAASISHPSLVHVYDSGSDAGTHFIVMELLDHHRSLRAELDEHGPLSRDAVLRIGRGLLAGLRLVHARGLVHCDIKAGNVMLGRGPAKLIDFGIARPPHDGLEGDTSIGSLGFMSPEQLHGEALTPASDLFSLGVVLYEAITGRLPFAGSTPAEVGASQDAGRVRPPSTLVGGLPGRLDAAILQALRRDPEARFRNADAMAAALDAVDAEITESRDADETRIVRMPAPEPGPSAERGYVPPPAPEPAPRRAPRRSAPNASRRRSAGSGLGGVIGTLIILVGAVLVVVLVIVPLLDLGGRGSGSPTADPRSSAPPGTVLVPATIGLPTAQAIDAARETGLDWTVRCADDPAQAEGIIDQEPSAGTPVAPGSAFTMYSARFSDCS